MYTRTVSHLNLSLTLCAEFQLYSEQILQHSRRWIIRTSHRRGLCFNWKSMYGVYETNMRSRRVYTQQKYSTFGPETGKCKLLETNPFTFFHRSQNYNSFFLGFMFNENRQSNQNHWLWNGQTVWSEQKIANSFRYSRICRSRNR